MTELDFKKTNKKIRQTGVTGFGKVVGRNREKDRASQDPVWMLKFFLKRLLVLIFSPPNRISKGHDHPPSPPPLPQGSNFKKQARLNGESQKEFLTFLTKRDLRRERYFPGRG